MPHRDPSSLRSYRWFGPDNMRSFGHRSRAKQSGFTADDMTGKPVIAILNTWSDANPCHAHFRMTSLASLSGKSKMEESSGMQPT